MDSFDLPGRRWKIRVAVMEDLPAIVEIYNQAVPTHQSTARTSLVTVEERKPWFLEHEPQSHPIFVAEMSGKIAGWCSLSAYRAGRSALRFTSEISYYISNEFQRQGIGSALVRHALSCCPSLQIRNVVAVVIDQNAGSCRLLERLGFSRWGYLPQVLEFDGSEYGEYYYGMRIQPSSN